MVIVPWSFNLSLLPPAPFSQNLDTISKVTNVTSPDAAGTYAPGDVVTIWVSFDQFVAVVGEPVFYLNTGKGEPGRAVYVEGSGNQARDTIVVDVVVDGGGTR